MFFSTFKKMKKYKTIIIAFLLITIHIIIILVLFKKPSMDNDKIYKHNKQSNISDLKRRTENSKTMNNNLYYLPSTKSGHLRINKKEKKLSKNYQNLIGKPYQGAIVVDAKSGKVLFQNHGSAFGYPASITKLMTLLITLEAIDNGKISLNDKILINDEIMGIGGSQLYLDVKETDFTVEDMLYAIMVHSANDAARALSIHVAGSKINFVNLMNKKAKELGMNATKYYSDHGLIVEENQNLDVSTPHDIAILALACLNHPNTLKYTSTELIYLGKRKFMCSTRNSLIKKIDGYKGCDGLKTGFTKRAGFSLVATAEKNNKRIIAVLLGCEDKEIRNNTARELLDFGFNAFEN